MVVSPTGLGSENKCAGEGQQQLQMIDPSSRERGCYMTMTSGVQLKKYIYSGRKFQGARCQDQPIGGKPSVVK
jgi:hypothetical protein